MKSGFGWLLLGFMSVIPALSLRLPADEASAVTVAGSPPRPAEEKVDFERMVKPILESACIRCHGAARFGGDLRLDTKERALAGGEYGPVIRPGQPERSTLYTTTILPDDDLNVMPPPRGALSRAQSELLRRWIEQGAAWPDDAAALRPTRRVFAREILAVFKKSCVRCHGPDDAQGELRLNDRAGIDRGGLSGPVLVPHEADASLLYTKLRSPSTHDSFEPPRLKDKLLEDDEAALLRDWIIQGAPWPDADGAKQ